MVGAPPLVLDMYAFANILLNKITTWNDPRIKALNLELRDTLPNKPIIVVGSNKPSAVVGLISRALSFIPEFFELASENASSPLPLSAMIET